MKSRPWTRDELIIAINLYCRTPFGKLHSKNPNIIEVAKYIKRTPSALSMKLVNFASIDPIQKARSIKGLSNASNLDHEIWDEFQSNWEKLAYESQEAFSKINIAARQIQTDDDIVDYFSSKTESERLTRVRLVQGFFRDMIMTNYQSSCSFCGIKIPDVLNASHIIPWRLDEKRRADPRNGICLCSLHDRAFDRGLLGISGDHKILVSSSIKYDNAVPLHKIGLIEIEGKPIIEPSRFMPDDDAIEFHRNEIFNNSIKVG